MKHLSTLAIGFLALLFGCQKKQDEHVAHYRTEYDHIKRKWKVQEAYTNNSGNESDNTADVTYDWVSWTVEFWGNDTYKIIDYSSDSSACIIESGSWQINIEGLMLLKGSENLIEFSSGNIIDQGDTENNWIRKKNESDELWVWIKDSFYAGTGVFLKMVPF